MGLNGTILLFPKAGRSTTSPEATAKRAIEAFERENLLLPDTASHCQAAKPWNSTFAEFIEEGTIAASDCSTYIVSPERILPALKELVFLLDVDADGNPSAIELPYIEFSVTTKALPIVNGWDGQTLCTTWAVVAFSYEDVRYNEEIHRIRDEKHPVLKALSEVFSSPIGWAIQIR